MPSPDVKEEDEQTHIENQSTTHNHPPPPPPDEEVEVEDEDDEEEEEEGDDYDDDEEDEDDDEEEEEDLNFDSPSSTSIPKVSISEEQTPQQPVLIDQKLQITPITPTTTTTTSTTPIEEKKPPLPPPPPPPPMASDESRKLFQRLWTDEDEIGLLQGYLDFTIQRGGYHNSSYHHDTGPFYDQIKTRLQLDFNKNQLVEKLRRLKKKYRNVVTRATSGKEVSFKTPHDQATYQIARKIWGDGISSSRSVGGAKTGKVQEEAAAADADDEGSSNPLNNNDVKPNIVNVVVEKKLSMMTPTPARRSQKRAAEAELPNMPKFRKDSSSTTNAIEDTVRSCLSPLFKELINCATNGPCNLGGLGGVALNPMPINFGGSNSLVNFGNGEKKLDERWRKQQILELEVYSKRIELVQDQIKSTLEDLRSMDK